MIHPLIVKSVISNRFTKLSNYTRFTLSCVTLGLNNKVKGLSPDNEMTYGELLFNLRGIMDNHVGGMP